MRINRKMVFISAGVLLAILLILLIANYLSLPEATMQRIMLVDSAEFEKLINSEEVFVLNTHTPYEGEIYGTDATIEDWQNINLYQEKLPRDKNTPIAVYCRSGRMSAEAARQLEEMEYNSIYDLKGGMNAWKESGRGIIYK